MTCAKSADYLTLKWGTLKSWNLTSAKGQELLRKYHELGSSASAMLQHDTQEQKALLCQMIDECGSSEIWLDWDGKKVPKEEAKKYVMEYGRNHDR
jgi:hypothetical protein